MLPESLQFLLTLEAIATATNEDRARDYLYMKNDVRDLIDAANSGQFSPLIGAGSPEGAVAANYSLKYIDTTGPTEYYNSTVGATTGWVAL